MGEKKRRQAAGSLPVSQPGALLDAQGAADRAECRRLEQVITAAPGNHAARYQLSLRRHRMSVLDRERQQPAAAVAENLRLALEAITDAISIHPQVDDYWVHFSECIKVAVLPGPLSPNARSILARALEHPAVPPQSLVTPLVSLIRSHPAFGALAGYLFPNAGLERAAGPRLVASIAAVFQEPLLQRLLQLGVVAEPVMERLLVLARRTILRETVQYFSDAPPLAIEIIAAIACQCYITEYLYEVSADELSDLESLRQAIHARSTADRTPPAHWLALTACYQSLGEAEYSGRLAAAAAGSALAGLVEQQIGEPARERALRDAIPRAESGMSGTSAAVGTQYEEHPYPRWVKCVFNRGYRDFAGLIRQSLPNANHSIAPGEAPRILVAGCGTGQHPINSVSPCRDARILAIDLSLASLAYAKRKTLELGIDNIDYRQADILDLGALPERFDLIESIGVLHHLEDPARGWRVLRGLLKPRGFMRIALYSELARQAVVRMREQIAAQGMTPTLPDMRRCREYIRPLLDGFGTQALNYSPDFYCASGCRDLFFHVMEHRFTLPQIAQLLDGLELEFLGFQLPTVALGERYRAEFRDDPQATNLANWHRFEQANPWMFQGMYFLWLRGRG